MSAISRPKVTLFADLSASHSRNPTTNASPSVIGDWLALQLTVRDPEWLAQELWQAGQGSDIAHSVSPDPANGSIVRGGNWQTS
jgi:hypothetical protein